MDKKKQIEEMANDVYGDAIEIKGDSEYAAETMYEKGYRKIPEGAVVLTKKELAEIQLKYYRQGVVGATSRFSEQVYDLIPLAKDFGAINREVIDEICKTVVKLEEIEYD